MAFAAAQANDRWDAAQTRNAGGHAVSAPTTVTRAEFVACVDRCVRVLIRQADAATAMQADAMHADTMHADTMHADMATVESMSSESAPAQLRAWLNDGKGTLADGTPVDFALFDATILSVEERLPPRDAAAQHRLLHASRLLAESVYAWRQPASQR
jgi:hypothetical protein